MSHAPPNRPLDNRAELARLIIHREGDVPVFVHRTGGTGIPPDLLHRPPQIPPFGFDPMPFGHRGLPRAEAYSHNEVPTVKCVVCEEKFRVNQVYTAACHHYHCADCLKANVRSSLSSLPFRPVKCCFAIPSEQLRNFGALSADEVKQYELKVEELTNPYRKLYCWGQDCGAFISVSERSKRVGTCTSCGRKTCKACNEKSHWGPCNKDKLQETRDSEEEVEKLAETKGWKRCPNCLTLIQKAAGCNHMTELTDKHRVDPLNSSSLRRIMISQFTPVAPEHCTQTRREVYMPYPCPAIEYAILNAAAPDSGWPDGILDKLEVEICCHTAPGILDTLKKEFPVVLFDTGLDTTRPWYTATVVEIASLGYQVIVMDHPYETDVVKFPDGEIIYGGGIPEDPNALNRTVMFGHSYGGAAAAWCLRVEPRILAGFNLDGDLWGPPTTHGVARPFVNFEQYRPHAWGREIHFDDISENSLSDFSLIGDITRLSANESLDSVWIGNVTGTRVMDVLRAYLGDYFKSSWMGPLKVFLLITVRNFPDIQFLRIDGPP
ncbi:hypothetical protein F5Y16DRAFT_424286 [Xylariaceae sp. FL0255]|nr:hypothetical protein F5Y16DRAFT_424286 [Xylariaceae sp. FL0255]